MREKERERERREREKEKEREREMYNMVIEFKRNDGCLGTF